MAQKFLTPLFILKSQSQRQPTIQQIISLQHSISVKLTTVAYSSSIQRQTLLRESSLTIRRIATYLQPHPLARIIFIAQIRLHGAQIRKV